MALVWSLLILLLLSINSISGHFFDQVEGDCPHGWRKTGFTCFKYVEDNENLEGALKKCKHMEDFSEIYKHYNEDISLLLTLSKIPEFRRDHGDIREIESKVLINAIKYKEKWYEILKVPDHGFSIKTLIRNEMHYMQEIIKGDFKALGFNESIYYEGKNYDTLLFDPKDGDLRIARNHHHFDYVCLHKRNNKPGDKCAGTLAECNNRGTCFEGKCYCLNGYINDPCIYNPGEPAVIVIEVVSALDGSLLEGIQVSYTGSETGSANTNSDGQVTISTFSSSAPITVSASDSAYDDAPAQTFAVPPGGTLIVIALNPSSPDPRLVISWATDSDIDHHVRIFDSTGAEICHLYYSNDECLGSSLDTDSGGFGPETITIGDVTSGYKYLYFVTNYDETPLFDDGVNCVATVYGPNNAGSVQVPIVGTEKYFLVGCFETFDNFQFITQNNNVPDEPSVYPAECP